MADTQQQPANGAPAPAQSALAINTAIVQVPRVAVLSEMLPSLGLEVEAEFSFRWTVDKWAATAKSTKRLFSPERILLFPSGNQQSDTLSVFLDSVDAPGMPKDGLWHICVQFVLAIVNYKDETCYRSASKFKALSNSSHSSFLAAQHRFNPYEADWGFNHLVKLNQLLIPLDPTKSDRSLVEDDKTVFIVHMRVLKDVTGFLWHNYLSRKATYSIPTEHDLPTKSIPLALQRVFYLLQHSDSPVGTTELTKSFGWDAMDSFMQHDVQEFNRVLQENLETKMVGTTVEGVIRNLFVGKYKSYVRCLDVEFESSRVEDFYDIQLNVKGKMNVTESFQDYVSTEMLDGDNKYFAENFGLQRAEKGVTFVTFPPVLFLQLKRFEYDVEHDCMVKINDRYEYPATLNLDSFLEQKPITPQSYWLYGVLVHTGNITGGHYCAFLRPQKNGNWFKFDDDRVTPCLPSEVFDDNFGGGNFSSKFYPSNVVVPKQSNRYTNAYMLIYIRDRDTDSIFISLEDADVQEHLRKRMESEQSEAEKKKKEREEQHLYVNIKVVLEEHAAKHRGFDLCNFESRTSPITEVLSFRELKERTLADFKAGIKFLGESLHVPPDRLNIWSLVGRQNKTIRPDCKFTSMEDVLSSLRLFPFFADSHTGMEEIREKFSKALGTDLRLFVEIAEPNDKSSPQHGDKSITIFLKYYDPTTSLVRYVGSLFIPNKTSKISDILPVLWKRASLPAKTRLLVFEEVKPDMIDELSLRQSFAKAEIGDGDIILYQRDMTGLEAQIEDETIGTAKQYFDQMHNRNTIIFKPKPGTETKSRPELELVLHKKMLYDDVLKKLAEKIGANPHKIQVFTGSGLMSNMAVRRHDKMVLQDMLNVGFYNQLVSSSVLYYEELDVEVSELETKRFLTVSFVERNGNELGPYSLLVPKNATAGDVIKKLKTHIGELPVHQKADLRLYEVIKHKIQKFYSNSDTVRDVTEMSTFYVEDVLPEDSKLRKGDAHVHVFSYNGHPTRAHGIPFKFPLRKGELFSATRERLSARIDMSDADASKAKWFIIPSGFSNPIPIVESDVLAEKNFGPYDYIGVDRPGKFDRTVRDVNAGKGIKMAN
ncbi:hypothetical protein HDU83_009329 [Entophlyctis luteolus]|nr:hypothetical protein HDU83_009329 [Entophlyctis luteolus]